jgi:hypothetical protein
MMAPCSAKARGRTGENFSRARWSQFATTSTFSAKVSWSSKSAGNGSSFRLTCSFRRYVDTPQMGAKSASRITLCPRMAMIRWSTSPGAGRPGDLCFFKVFMVSHCSSTSFQILQNRSAPMLEKRPGACNWIPRIAAQRGAFLAERPRLSRTGNQGPRTGIRGGAACHSSSTSAGGRSGVCLLHSSFPGCSTRSQSSHVRWVCCWREVISIRRRTGWWQVAGRRFSTSHSGQPLV